MMSIFLNQVRVLCYLVWYFDFENSDLLIRCSVQYQVLQRGKMEELLMSVAVKGEVRTV